MLWLIPAFILSSTITFFLGYYFQGLVRRIEYLEQATNTKLAKTELEEPKSEIIDPLDEVQTAMYEHKKMMEKLNPHE